MVFECVRQAAVRRLEALSVYLAICDCWYLQVVHVDTKETPKISSPDVPFVRH